MKKSYEFQVPSHDDPIVIGPVFDYTDGKLEETVKESLEEGNLTLIECLANLIKGHGKNNNEISIGIDFAPRSFEFAIKRPNGSIYLNGGIIFHDIRKGIGTSALPSLSVSIDNDPKPHWSIHT